MLLAFSNSCILVAYHICIVDSDIKRQLTIPYNSSEDHHDERHHDMFQDAQSGL